MPTLRNSFEGGTAGTAVTTANSGGASGDALDAVTGTVTYRASPAKGALSAELGAAAGATFSYAAKLGTVPEAWARTYVYLTVNPGSNMAILSFRAGTTNRGFAVVTATGKIQLINAGGSGVLTSTPSVPLNAWFRLEARCLSNATTGQIEYRLYDVDDVGLLASGTASNTNTGAGTIDNVLTQGQATAVSYRDDFAASTVGFLGTSSNQGPVVNAGPDQDVAPGAAVTLTATAVDIEGNTPLSYAWTVDASYTGPPITLSGANTATVTFTAPSTVDSVTVPLNVVSTDSLGAAGAPDQALVNVAPRAFLFRRETGVLVRRALRRKVAGVLT